MQKERMKEMGVSSENNTTPLQKSFAMNGGDGKYSYSKNSTVQKEACMVAKEFIDDVIADKLEIKKIPSALDTFCIADLGCSVGPNTIIAMEYIIAAVKKKCKLEGLISSDLPEFQVFFNDQVKNDFNMLFTSLPQEKHYFVAGVPGSFHGRVFPKSSIHIANASFALHWLSEIPKEVLTRDSPAWNKGKIYYTSASSEVGDAYAAQFTRDISTILSARAKEIVVGGLLLIVIASTPDGLHRSESLLGMIYDVLGSSLMDMAREGLIREDQVDSFNLPFYVTNRKEMKGLIENNGCFSIEKMEFIDMETSAPLDTEKHVTHIRAAMEGIIAAHFGGEIIDDLFSRFRKKATVLKDLDEKHLKGALLFIALKRNEI